MVSLTHSSKLASATRSGENKTPSVSAPSADSKVAPTASALLAKPHVFSLLLCFCYHPLHSHSPFTALFLNDSFFDEERGSCSLPWQAPWVFLSHSRVSLTPCGWPWKQTTTNTRQCTLGNGLHNPPFSFIFFPLCHSGPLLLAQALTKLCVSLDHTSRHSNCILLLSRFIRISLLAAVTIRWVGMGETVALNSLAHLPECLETSCQRISCLSFML